MWITIQHWISLSMARGRTWFDDDIFLGCLILGSDYVVFGSMAACVKLKNYKGAKTRSSTHTNLIVGQSTRPTITIWSIALQRSVSFLKHSAANVIECGFLPCLKQAKEYLPSMTTLLMLKSFGSGVPFLKTSRLVEAEPYSLRN